MALWIEQVLKVNPELEIVLGPDFVSIGTPAHLDGDPKEGFFSPETREQANAMSVALKLAAKRLEEIGKGLQ